MTSSAGNAVSADDRSPKDGRIGGCTQDRGLCPVCRARGRSQKKRKTRLKRAKGAGPIQERGRQAWRKGGEERGGEGEAISRARRAKVRRLMCDSPNLWNSIRQRMRGAGWGSRSCRE